MLVSSTRAALVRSGASRSIASPARSAGRLYADSVASTSSFCLARPSLPTSFSSTTASLRQFSHATRPALSNDADKSSTPPSDEPIEPRLSLTFTCTVEACGHRSTHEFTKRSYERGIVLVQCPNCKNRHLIADHLSWFTETADEPKTIEQIVAAKGGRVRRGVQVSDGKGYETVEILSDSDDGASDGSAANTPLPAPDTERK